MEGRTVLLLVASFCVVFLGVALGQPATSCESDTECAGGQRCVLHGNYSRRANCEVYRTCITVTSDGCTCNSGYACYLKDCQEAPFECLLLEDLNTRCGGSEGPRCASNEICGYRRTGVVCIKCPCYGTDEAVCVPRDPQKVCHPKAMVQVESRGSTGYVCKQCASHASVLTARSRQPTD
ncbi:uncharacterized protein ISCGN_029524 [Ixodes scapularis]